MKSWTVGLAKTICQSLPLFLVARKASVLAATIGFLWLIGYSFVRSSVWTPQPGSSTVAGIETSNSAERTRTRRIVHVNRKPPTLPVVATGATEIAAASDSAAGFALQPRMAGDLTAEVEVPDNCWFSLASTKTVCDPDVCALAPIRRHDRKLNTAMEWEQNPDQAAVKAALEGKLVFLIHVSGNFAQPGFT